MKIISSGEIKKLTIPHKRGTTPKSPILYKTLIELPLGKSLFISKKEWAKLGYSQKDKNRQGFRYWFTVAKDQKRRKHLGRLSRFQWECETFEEGWTVKKIK